MCQNPSKCVSLIDRIDDKRNERMNSLRFQVRHDAKLCAQAFEAGAILGYPTEGVWGIGCRADRGDLVRQVIKLKQRAPNKGVILLASDESQLADFVLDQSILVQARLRWPGVCTWVVPCRLGLDHALTGGRDTIAVRITDHAPMRAVLNRLDFPIVSTSANLSGRGTRTRSWLTPWGNKLDGWYRAPLGGLGHSTPIRQA